MASSPRSAYLDNAKAILITLVVFAHSVGPLTVGHPGTKALHQLILVFHMPAFIFVSGYLSKPDAFTRKGARALLVLAWTYLLFNALNHWWAVTFDGRVFDPWKVIYSPDYALWFLVALFWWRLMLPLFAWGNRNAHAALSVAVAVAIAIGSGYVIEQGGYLAVQRTLVFLPFFVAGYRAKQLGWSLPRAWWTRALAVTAFLAVYATLLVSRVIRDDNLLYQSRSFIELGDVTWKAGLVRLFTLLASAVLVAAFLQLVSSRRTIVSALGATTLSVYVWHAFTLRNLRHLGLYRYVLGSWPALLLTVVAMVVIFGYGPIPRATLWVTSLGRKKGS